MRTLSVLLSGLVLLSTGCSSGAEDGSSPYLADGSDAGPDSDGAPADATPHDAVWPDVPQPDAATADATPPEAATDASPTDTSPPDAAVGCPALTPEHIEQWGTTPWVAPTSGDAEQVIRLSTQNQLHFSRAVIRFDFETTEVPGDWTHIGVVRNRAIPSGWNHLAYYGWLLSRNIPTRQIELALNGCQKGAHYTLLPYTNYTLTYDYDAIAGTATLTLEEHGGVTVSTSCPATSSLVPIGQGLHIYMGMTTSHPDYPVVMPPHGWTFRNFVADLTPGGPYGPDAPPCP